MNELTVHYCDTYDPTTGTCTHEHNGPTGFWRPEEGGSMTTLDEHYAEAEKADEARAGAEAARHSICFTPEMRRAAAAFVRADRLARDTASH
jgi:hypothetical protein